MRYEGTMAGMCFVFFCFCFDLKELHDIQVQVKSKFPLCNSFRKLSVSGPLYTRFRDCDESECSDCVSQSVCKMFFIFNELEFEILIHFL